jgi:hypothetical protein
MTLALDRPFEARITPAQKRARAAADRLRWIVLLMVSLNVLVWGGIIAAARGLVDMHALVDQIWIQAAHWLAMIPHVSVTISR